MKESSFIGIVLIIVILILLRKIESFGCSYNYGQRHNIDYRFGRTCADGSTYCSYCGNSSYRTYCY